MKKLAGLIFFGLLFISLVNAASLTLSPTTISAGNMLNVTLFTLEGEKISSSISVYDSYNNYKTSINLNCTNYICSGYYNFELYVGNDWLNGDYSINAYYYRGGNSSGNPNPKATFTVVGSNATVSSVKIFPAMIKPSQRIYLNVTPGTKGFMRYAYIYSPTGASLGNIDFGSSCVSSICTNSKNATYVIPSNSINGTYTIYLRDYTFGGLIYANFTVYGSKNVLSYAQIKVVPNNTGAGNQINITVIPGTYGTGGYVSFYNTTNSYKGYLYLGCSTCYKTILKRYTIPSGFSRGYYKTSIYDYTLKKNVESYFHVN